MPGADAPKRRKSPKPVRVRVIGGLCGAPIRTPNSKVQRGWSQTAALWRFDGEPDSHVWCRGERYTYHPGPEPFFAYDPDEALRAEIIRSVGDQTFWRRRWRS